VNILINEYEKVVGENDDLRERLSTNQYTPMKEGK